MALPHAVNYWMKQHKRKLIAAGYEPKAADAALKKLAGAFEQAGVRTLQDVDYLYGWLRERKHQVKDLTGYPQMPSAAGGAKTRVRPEQAGVLRRGVEEGKELAVPSKGELAMRQEGGGPLARASRMTEGPRTYGRGVIEAGPPVRGLLGAERVVENVAAAALWPSRETRIEEGLMEGFEPARPAVTRGTRSGDFYTKSDVARALERTERGATALFPVEETAAVVGKAARWASKLGRGLKGVGRVAMHPVVQLPLAGLAVAGLMGKRREAQAARDVEVRSAESILEELRLGESQRRRAQTLAIQDPETMRALEGLVGQMLNGEREQVTPNEKVGGGSRQQAPDSMKAAAMQRLLQDLSE